MQHQSSSSLLWRKHVRPSRIAIAVGAVLVAIVSTAKSQEREALSPVYTVLYAFTGGFDGDGAFPNNGGSGGLGLTRDDAGNLYGVTTEGGDLSKCVGFNPGCGIVYEVGTDGKEKVLHTFTGPDGANPGAALVRDDRGNLYGTTMSGGSGSPFQAGVVFKLDLSGKETVLHSFSGGTDGSGPGAGVFLDNRGNLYGTTQSGGDLSKCKNAGCGVVFKLSPTGNETVLYTFTGPDGKTRIESNRGLGGRSLRHYRTGGSERERSDVQAKPYW